VEGGAAGQHADDLAVQQGVEAAGVPVVGGVEVGADGSVELPAAAVAGR
jgi:hypothetical protein